MGRAGPAGTLPFRPADQRHWAGAPVRRSGEGSAGQGRVGWARQGNADVGKQTRAGRARGVGQGSAWWLGQQAQWQATQTWPSAIVFGCRTPPCWIEPRCCGEAGGGTAVGMAGDRTVARPLLAQTVQTPLHAQWRLRRLLHLTAVATGPSTAVCSQLCISYSMDVHRSIARGSLEALAYCHDQVCVV